MNGLKKFGLVTCVVLFGPLFLLSVASYAFNRTLGDQEYTKKTIIQAGFYQAVGETIKTEALGGDEADPLINNALQSAVSGENLQKTLEPLIDSTYSWLDGTTPQPQFSLAIKPLKDNFQQSLTDALKARASSLPDCNGAVPTSGEDIFSYNCIPPGTDINAVVSEAVSSVTNNASVFSDEVVADGSVNAQEAQDLGINNPTQNLPNGLPKLFQFLTQGQWWFVVGTLLTSVGVVLLSRTWLYGLRKLGVLLLINGLGLLVMGLILGYVVSSLVPTTSVETTESAVNSLEQASKIILSDNASILKVIGLIASVLGIAGAIVSTVLLKRSNPVPKPEAKPTVPTATPATTTKPAAPIKQSK